ncbi:AraC family transcriptional regulator protein [Rhizobium gallicum]|uniref:AraC family transcriptional regulator protein n=1 Tax=Rhizobium gallicum TaxID=56730 RepID=A0A1L5NM06_9HYPH|nr:AraC family transcriptional regulator [Rhizobium gallicum]APO68908.1 AraC family transcriptional regulator protein [Rhizobium gallicum]
MTLQMLVGTGEINESGARPGQVSLTRSWLGGAAIFDDREWYCTRAEIRWCAPAHLIVLTHRGGTERTFIRPEDGQSHLGRDRPGTISFVPAGMARQAVYEEAALKYSAVWIAPSFLDTLAPKDGLERALINFSDPLLASLLGGLREAAGAAHPPDEAYLEQLLRLCLHRIRVLPTQPSVAVPHAKLSLPIVGRVDDFIDANLHRNVRLAEMAAAAGLGPDSFARRFKATTGLSPYAYVLEKRIARAEHMLAATPAPIAAVALQLGFAGQSHFTTMFKRRRGITPQAYRASFS